MKDVCADKSLGCRNNLILIRSDRGRVSMDKESVYESKEGVMMQTVTLFCYLFSLLSFGIGYSKMLIYKNALLEHVNTSDYTIDLSLAMGFFVLTIFFAIIGFAFFIIRIMKGKEYLTESSSLKSEELKIISN